MNKNMNFFLSTVTSIVIATSGCATWIRPEVGTVGTEGVKIITDSIGTLDNTRPFNPTKYAFQCPRSPSTDDYLNISKSEGFKVVVKHPKADRDISGFLLFCPVSSESRSPAKRSYRIIVPDENLKELSGGNMIVLYENTGVDFLPAWILWLSYEPLPMPPPAKQDNPSNSTGFHSDQQF